jgi:hypothetical protein
MEFRIWVETRLDGRILERELVSEMSESAGPQCQAVEVCPPRI